MSFIDAIWDVFQRDPYSELSDIQDLPESDYAQRVKELCKRALFKEYSDSQYHEKIYMLLQELPPHLEKKIDVLVEHRIKVVQPKDSRKKPDLAQPKIRVGGSSQTGYVIFIDQESMSSCAQDALNFITFHELGHILREDSKRTARFKLFALVGLTALTLLVSNVAIPVLAMFGFVISMAGAFCFYSHSIESAADDFALKHASTQDIQKAINFFKEIQTNSSFYQKLMTLKTHPSLSTRIKKLENALERNPQKNLLNEPSFSFSN